MQTQENYFTSFGNISFRFFTHPDQFLKLNGNNLKSYPRVSKLGIRPLVQTYEDFTHTQKLGNPFPCTSEFWAGKGDIFKSCPRVPKL
jgi:hypothetical protein